jgi:excisionase family DNA binding protein
MNTPGLPVIGGTPSNPDHMWKVSEIAVKLNISKMSVYRLIHTGDMSALRVGRSYRVTNGALARYLKEAGLRSA